MNHAGNFALEDGETLCDECRRTIRTDEKANPQREAEAWCHDCWDGIPHDFGDEGSKTTRIPAETMRDLVFKKEEAA